MSDEEFQRQKVCYQQNCEQLRSLSIQMNKIPVLAMTLTGGLWFAAGLADGLEPGIRFGLLIFSGFCDIALVLAALRIRDVIQSYLETIEQFYPEGFASDTPKFPKVPRFRKYSMIILFNALMGIGALISFAGALYLYWPFYFSRGWGVIALLLILLCGFLFFFERSEKKSTA